MLNVDLSDKLTTAGLCLPPCVRGLDQNMLNVEEGDEVGTPLTTTGFDNENDGGDEDDLIERNKRATGRESWSTKLMDNQNATAIGTKSFEGSNCCSSCGPCNTVSWLSWICVLAVIPCVVHFYYYWTYDGTQGSDPPSDQQKLIIGLGVLGTIIFLHILISCCCGSAPIAEYEQKGRDYGLTLLMAGTLLGFLISVKIVHSFIIGNACHYCGKDRTGAESWISFSDSWISF